MLRNFSSWTFGWILGLIALIAVGAAPAIAKQEVIVFHAGSLTVPFAEVEKRLSYNQKLCLGR